jgi:hypothetical protein
MQHKYTINANRISIEIPDGKKPLGSPKHKQENKIRMNLTEIGRKCGLGSSRIGHGPMEGSYEPQSPTHGKNFLD